MNDRERVRELRQMTAQIIQLFGPLPRHAIAAFASKFAEWRGMKSLPASAEDEIIQKLLNSKEAYEYSPNLLTGRPTKPSASASPKKELAYWVFLDHAGLDNLQTVLVGPSPAVVTYFKNESLYHIVPCEGDGNAEIDLSLSLIDETNQRRAFEDVGIKEKFMFVFSDMAAFGAAKVHLIPNSIASVISLDETEKPTIQYFKCERK